MLLLTNPKMIAMWPLASLQSHFVRYQVSHLDPNLGLLRVTGSQIFQVADQTL